MEHRPDIEELGIELQALRWPVQRAEQVDPRRMMEEKLRLGVADQLREFMCHLAVGDGDSPKFSALAGLTSDGSSFLPRVGELGLLATGSHFENIPALASCSLHAARSRFPIATFVRKKYQSFLKIRRRSGGQEAAGSWSWPGRGTSGIMGDDLDSPIPWSGIGRAGARQPSLRKRVAFMSIRAPILVTGAAGQTGGVGGEIVEILRGRDLPVRAFVRTDDDRAECFARAGPGRRRRPHPVRREDVARALEGCRRMYFGKSVSASHIRRRRPPGRPSPANAAIWRCFGPVGFALATRSR